MATPSPAAEDLTKCGICKKTIIEPRALSCLHAFCLVCLQDWTGHDITCTVVACPTCKKSISLPDNGVDGLPGNVFVSSLIDRSQAMTPHNVACVSNDSWVLEKEFAKDKIKFPTGVAITPSGYIAVTNWRKTFPVQVYSADGKFKFSLDKKSSDAFNVAVAPDDGRFFVTTEHNKCVTVYSSEGHYLFEFPAGSPGGVITAEDTCLTGIAINMKGQVLVGDTNTEYISIHDLSGIHINSIKIPISPWFIATRQNSIVVSARKSHTNVHVFDFTGKQLYTIEPPQGVTKWCPCGVCVSVNDEICIANNCGRGKSTIHCFTTNGKHLGCIYKGLESPEGIALMENDKTLVVVEHYGTVKVLTRKK